TKELAKALQLLGRSEEALAVLERGLQANPSDCTLWSWKGMILLASHRIDEAQAALSKCVELEPYAGTYHNLANILSIRGELTPAEAAARKAIDLDPDAAGPHNTLALVLMRRSSGILYEDPMAVPVEQLKIDHWINREPGQAALLTEAAQHFKKAIECQ